MKLNLEVTARNVDGLTFMIPLTTRNDSAMAMDITVTQPDGSTVSPFVAPSSSPEHLALNHENFRFRVFTESNDPTEKAYARIVTNQIQRSWASYGLAQNMAEIAEEWDESTLKTHIILLHNRPKWLLDVTCGHIARRYAYTLASKHKLLSGTDKDMEVYDHPNIKGCIFRR